MSKWARAAMPQCAEFIDACAEAFGRDAVQAAIRNGLAGGTDFYASENGHVLGSQASTGLSISADEILERTPRKGRPA
jgi:hypothetical protein